MTDQELLMRTSAARGLVHNAVAENSDAWDTRAAEFSDLVDECSRRGLQIPACNCPAGNHA
jgi:hypothetical protein